jgi:hypothetical protein
VSTDPKRMAEAVKRYSAAGYTWMVEIAPVRGHVLEYLTFRNDVVKERMEPVNGIIRVPETPGLGVTLDRDALKSLASARLPPPPQFILRSTFKNGAVMYNIADPDQSISMTRPDA